MPKLKKKSAVAGELLTPVLSSTPGRVWVERSRTVNLGDYNSLKVTVGVDMPINPDSKMLEQIGEAVIKGDELAGNCVVEILEKVVPDERSKDYSK